METTQEIEEKKILKNCWCHACQKEFQIQEIKSNKQEYIICIHCQSDCVEEIENEEYNPKNFKPETIIQTTSSQQQWRNQTQNQNRQRQFNATANIQIISGNNISQQRQQFSVQPNNISQFLTNLIQTNLQQSPNNLPSQTVINISNFQDNIGINNLFSQLFPNSPGLNFQDFSSERNFQRIISYLMEHDPNFYGTPPASQKSVESLKQIKFSELDNNNKDIATACTVCQEDFNSDDIIILMPCKHFFHEDCLKPWLKMHNQCPICRHQLPTDDEDYNSKQQINQ